MQVDPRDAHFMGLALELAERGRGRVEPNPLVGAVVVRDGEVVGEGWHGEFGRAHAEVEALRSAGERAVGATVYVTLEPCSHHGKTPPCTGALLEAGVARVVYACADPNPAAEGGGALLARAGVRVAAGVEEQRARDLNGRFFHAFSAAGGTRPWTELKLAMSLDARIADAHGRSAWITGEEARREVQRIRAGHAAIAVGVETVLADDPQLTVRGGAQPRIPPVRVVFDRTLRLPPRSRLAATAREVLVWVVCGPGARAEARLRLEAAGVRVVESDGLIPALASLRGLGVDSMLCEGGGRLASALLAAGAVDRLSLFYAPLMLGPAGRPGFPELPSPGIAEAGRWRHLRSRVLGADTLIELGR